MSESFEKLLILQDRDRRIAQLIRERTDIPKRRELIDERLKSHLVALDNAKESRQAKDLRIKELEGDIETFKVRLRKYKEQQLSVKNNDAYRALSREIQSTERSIRKLEDQELEVMESVEELNSRVEERDAEFKKEEASVQDELALLDERLHHIERELEEVKQGRGELTQGIEPAWLSRYERIFNHVGDFAIVGVENASCGGCHMCLPPQLVHDARKNDSLTICSYCGRILNHFS